MGSCIADENQLLSRIATRLPVARHAVVFAPHPDDEVFGCGGALALLRARKIPVSLIIVTDGAVGGDNALGNLTQIRSQESREAAVRLGVSEPLFWSYADRGLVYGEELIEKVAGTISRLHADLIFLPSPTELHPDHQTLALAGAEALRRLGGERRAAFYEINQPLPDPNLLLDITPVFAQKQAAMACFSSQLAEQPYDQRITGLNRFRSYFLGHGAEVAEAFMLLEANGIQPGLASLFDGPLAHRRKLGFAVSPTDIPLVSIIIRSMDRPMLSRALDSVALQTWPHIEVVVVNARGGEHSPLPDYCGRFPLRVVNQGGERLFRSRAANVGLAACRGGYIGFLDDDDTMDPDHIQHLADTLSRSETAVLAYAGVRGVNDDLPECPIVAVFQEPELSFAKLVLRNVIPLHAVLFPASLLASGAGFDEALALYEDWDFWLQLVRQNPCVFVPRVSATYHTGGHSAVSPLNSNPVIVAAATAAIHEKWWKLLTAKEREAIAELYYQLRATYADTEQQFTHTCEVLEQTREVLEHCRLKEEQTQQFLEQSLASYQSHLDQARAELAAMHASSSWRVTRPLRKLGTILRTLKTGGIAAVWDHYRVGRGRRKSQEGYAGWIRRNDTLQEAGRKQLRESLAGFENQPLISVIMPTYNANPDWLAEAIASVKGQLYPRWELCIADDASTDPAIGTLLNAAAADDPRVKVLFRQQNGHIAAASNSALELATGEYIALLDHDDLLAEQALFRVVEMLQQRPDADLLYSDEDLFDQQDGRACPLFKPDWSPHLAVSQAYLGHLVVLRHSLVRTLGGFRSEMDGAQDYDLWLRASRETDAIMHIPRLLYHWRKHPASTAATASSKPYAHEAGRKAVAQYLQSRYPLQQFDVVEREDLFTYRIRFNLPEEVLISIIIPTRDGLDLLRPCIESILHRSGWQRFEILIIDNGSTDPATLAYLAAVGNQDNRIKVVRANIPFNWSKLNNIGVQEARGQVFIFLNNDTLVISEDWLEQLAGYALLPDVGVVGALLLFADGTIQHSGVVVGMGGWADHPYRGVLPVHLASPFISPVLTRNVLAVTGACLAISREKFEKLGRYDESFIICGSDVELGLRAHREGLYNVLCAEARLYHLESKSRTSFIPPGDFAQSEQKYEPYRTRCCDPFYNPNLSLQERIPAVCMERGDNP